VTPQLVLGADAIFLDGFAPDRNPQMWEPPLLCALARLARRECRLATWTTARAVCDTLAQAGFELEFAPGFGHKRRMLLGRYAPRYPRRRHDPPSTFAGERSALVIGAGLAGASCAQALASRGWSVTVLDGAPPAQGASALPWGLMHPHFAADDNRLARLTRAGSLCTARTLARVAPGGVHAGRPAWQAPGVFQRASDRVEAERWHAAIEAQGMPSAWVRWLDAESAAGRLGMAPAEAGLWWPTAMVASPACLVAALLDHPRIRVVPSAVDTLRAEDGAWVVSARVGGPLASASVAIVSSALDAPRLLQAAWLPVRAVGGHVTFIESPSLRALRAGLGGDGTVLHAPDGTLAVGSTYEAADSDAPVLLDERSAARSNLARLQRLLAQPVAANVVGSFAGVRCAARDRLPYVGQVADEAAAAAGATALRGAHFDDLPRRPRLYAAFALGSRGLTFAPLAGELIAAAIEGEPLPIERDLAGALDPARVLLHRLRRGLPPLRGVAAGC
jgi:tRNA 5-methylaminomethyl-2-thiouridine biosynthesis bifunctional protein